MVLQLIHLSWPNYVAVISLHQWNPAWTNCGWSENNIFRKNHDWTLDISFLIHCRFHSNYRNNGGGFLIEYTAYKLDHFTTCGGNYSNASGVLTSPSYPNAYPELANCVYLISPRNGTYVNASFLSMDINCQRAITSDGFTSNYIEMRDGNSVISPIMGRFCGNGSNVPDFIQTTQNHLRIRYMR